MLIKAHALEKDDNGAKVRNTPNFRIFGKKDKISGTLITLAKKCYDLIGG